MSVAYMRYRSYVESRSSGMAHMLSRRSQVGEQVQGDGRMREPPTAPLLAWSRAFPATPEQVREARQFLAGIPGGSPAADDAILCLSELVTNAAVHSRSCMPGGHFTVRAEIHGGRLRVEVEDQGGPWTRPTPGGGQHGHGLHIISQLAHAWGITGDSDTGRRVPCGAGA